MSQEWKVIEKATNYEISNQYDTAQGASVLW